MICEQSMNFIADCDNDTHNPIINKDNDCDIYYIMRMIIIFMFYDINILWMFITD
jgi:hypothetical protein